MKSFLIAAWFVLCLSASAQAASVLFDVSGTVADANSWTSTLYVNGTAFPLVHTCALAGSVVTCTATLPTITSALVPGLAQTFELDLFDPVLNIRSVKSVPFIRNRPSVPTAGRFQ